MSGLAQFTGRVLMVPLLALFFYGPVQYSPVLASGPDVCGTDADSADDDGGVHLDIGGKRFSLKGVVTGTSGDPITSITVCGRSVDVSDAKIKGDLAEAKVEEWLVTVVGKVDGSNGASVSNGATLEAQQVRVHQRGKPSGVTGKPDDDDGGAVEPQDDKPGKGHGRSEDGPPGKALGRSEDGPPGKGLGRSEDGPPGLQRSEEKLEALADRLGDRIERQLERAAERDGGSAEARTEAVSVLEDLINRLARLLASIRG